MNDAQRQISSSLTGRESQTGDISLECRDLYCPAIQPTGFAARDNAYDVKLGYTSQRRAVSPAALFSAAPD